MDAEDLTQRSMGVQSLAGPRAQ
ncbi:MAG: hypothetical protein RJA10_2821, partial [Pseudomonadota bacterium]